MAQETNQTQVPMLCATGCGFYGNPRTNGMCSICYKDFLQRQNSSGRLTPPVVGVRSGGDGLPTQRSESGDPHSAPPFPPMDPPLEQNSLSLSSQASVTCLEECDEPAEDKGHKTEELKAMATADPDPDLGSAEGQDGTPENLKQKRSRCFMCRKKVGLTGFDCRCGNMFCGAHRYSDVHSCTFDYKADAAEKIRKENPVIVGEKIQKI